MKAKPNIILLADDDEDDRLIIQEAIDETEFEGRIQTVTDGEELLNYLHRRGRWTNPDTSPVPGLILLDLNLPKKDGRQILQEIKNHPQLKSIPIVVLTTSKAQQDIHQTYLLGVNSFVTKPISFKKMVTVMNAIAQYWFDVVKLPH